MFDRFHVCHAYYYVACRYHSGQASKGYAILSRLSLLGFRPGLQGDRLTDPDLRSAAACLLWRRRREIRREW